MAGGPTLLELENGATILVNGTPLTDWEVVVLHYRYRYVPVTIVIDQLVFIRVLHSTQRCQRVCTYA